MSRATNIVSLSDLAYRTIRQSILSGELPMGTPLSRRHLAEELGMSIVPVTAALQRLEAEELVDSRPRVGTHVKIPTPLDIRGHYMVREALETQSARLFSEKATRKEKEEIAVLAVWLDQAYARAAAGESNREQIYDLHQRHMRFHLRVAECTGFPALCSAMERNQILTHNWLYDTTADWHRLPDDFHVNLSQALCSADPAQAVEAMRRHVTFGMEQLLATLEKVLNEREHGTPAVARSAMG
jgi:DNA-binding GntR family transcriptional regulator